MKIPHMIVCTGVALAFSASILCQPQPQTGYHLVNCIKIKPDKFSEYQKWVEEEQSKVVQALVDSGHITAWYLLFAVLPTGTATDCGVIDVRIFSGLPHLMTPDIVGEARKKAGLNYTTQEWRERIDSLINQVTNGVYQTQLAVGEMKKDDYVAVNYMKSTHIAEWIAFEKKVWQPLAEQFVKNGVTRGWSVNLRVMPSGADLPFQGVTVDIYPSWDSVFKFPGPGFDELWKKVHPDMDINSTSDQMEKLRTISSTQLYRVAYAATSAK